MEEELEKIFDELLDEEELSDIAIKHKNRIWAIAYEPTDYVYDLKKKRIGRVICYVGLIRIKVFFEDTGIESIDYIGRMKERNLFFVSPNGNVAHDLLKNHYHVNSLIHFTQLENLPSIMEKGICPRSILGKDARTTDDLRLDEHEDATSFSVSFPNYRMFYSKRNEHPELTFIVLVIDIDVLLGIERKNVAYYSHNAASSSERNVEYFSKTLIDSIVDMFSDNKDKVREKYDLPTCFTTDPQAEIQIKDIVPSEFIREIHVEDETAEQKIKNLGIKTLPQIKICRDFFWGRKDREYWRGNNG